MVENTLESKVDKDLCKILHKQIDDKFGEHDKKLDEHEGKIGILEKSDAKKEEKIDNLCDQLKGLTKAIWGMVGSIFLILAGFLIWYIETIPGR